MEITRRTVLCLSPATPIARHLLHSRPLHFSFTGLTAANCAAPGPSRTASAPSGAASAPSWTASAPSCVDMVSPCMEPSCMEPSCTDFSCADSPCAADVYGQVSSMTLPSSMRMILSPYFLELGSSWETTIMSFSLERSFRRRYSCSPVLLSSAPVGSSARMTSGSFMRARAIATRCFCPPDSSVIFLSYSVPPSASVSSTRRRMASICSLLGRCPCISRARDTFFPTV